MLVLHIWLPIWEIKVLRDTTTLQNRITKHMFQRKSFRKMVFLWSMAKRGDSFLINLRSWRSRWQYSRSSRGSYSWSNNCTGHLQDLDLNIQSHIPIIFILIHKCCMLLFVFFLTFSLLAASKYYLNLAIRSVPRIDGNTYQLCTFVFRIKWICISWCRPRIFKQTNTEMEWIIGARYGSLELLPKIKINKAKKKQVILI